MIGLGRMGANMVRRLMKAGHECVVHDVMPAAVEALFRTDLDLKTSGGDPRVLLERLVVELCGAPGNALRKA